METAPKRESMEGRPPVKLPAACSVPYGLFAFAHLGVLRLLLRDDKMVGELNNAVVCCRFGVEIEYPIALSPLLFHVLVDGRFLL